MQIDGALLAADLRDTAAAARAIEEQGFDGILSFEGAHDPFLPLAAAAEHTTRVHLTTAIADSRPWSAAACATATCGPTERASSYNETAPEAVADLVRAFKED